MLDTDMAIKAIMQLSRASIPKCVQRFRARNPQWIGNRESNNSVKSSFPRLLALELQGRNIIDFGESDMESILEAEGYLS
ncbi:hypothetical protein CROQUDRAFT_400281 [Cronartium quercuum f. sp. fusiforme G11]|uniref:Uncharacterized protein n=1 Tax=Cronartium quercuum f. sp. fusiforme G11 TaxID=708437 RepID=A0A9P6N8X0_9BASI|nr:hypothetical protein CROQUDRAFT_400281 [Cronartium quercuum f. sp. fusiforme G11]